MTAWGFLITAFNYSFALHIYEALLVVCRHNPVSPELYLLACIPGLSPLESLISHQDFKAEPRGHRGSAESRTIYHRQRLLSPLPSLTGSALKYRSVAQ